jgi:hypothetical protein
MTDKLRLPPPPIPPDADLRGVPFPREETIAALVRDYGWPRDELERLADQILGPSNHIH